MAIHEENAPVPLAYAPRRSRYQKFYDSITSCDVFKVFKCDSEDEAKKFAAAARQKVIFEVQRRGMRVYLKRTLASMPKSR